MRILHLYARSNLDVTLPPDVVDELPKGLGVVSSIQHTHKLDKVCEQIGGVLAGQILGCRTEEAERIADKVSGFLYVGDGHFHPLAVVINMGKPIYCYNPRTKKLHKLKKEDFDNFLVQRKAALTKFLMANNVGIIVTTKTGQNSIRKARQLAAKKDKNYYIFGTDTLLYEQLDNFPFIDCWVNTACPRIVDEKPKFLNIDQALKVYES
ncbi:MAG: diphthamide synthesis protein [Candidatus Nanoarchaeia archaeon]